MRRFTPLLLSGLLAGCANYDNSLTLDFPDGRAQESLTVWQQRGLPAGTCAEEIEQLTLIVVPRAEIETDDYCGSENAGMNVLGCFQYDGSAPTIVMRSQVTIDFEEGIEHELRHWLAICSGFDGSGDPEHDDPGLWYRVPLRGGWDYGAIDN